MYFCPTICLNGNIFKNARSQIVVNLQIIIYFHLDEGLPPIIKNTYKKIKNI